MFVYSLGESQARIVSTPVEKETRNDVQIENNQVSIIILLSSACDGYVLAKLKVLVQVTVLESHFSSSFSQE
jgi:hypothetical protein